MVTAISPQRSRPGLGLGAGLVAAARGLAFVWLMLVGLGLMLVLLASLGLTALGVGVIIVGGGQHHEIRQVSLALLVLAAGLGIGRFFGPATLEAMRRLTNLTRRLAGEWCGVPIAEFHRPSAGPGDEKLSFIDRLKVLFTDVSTWRDLLWVTVNVVLGWVLAAASAVLIVVGVVVFIAPVLTHAIPPPAFPGNTRPNLLVLGAVMTALGVSAAPWLLRGYGLLASTMLAPAGKAELALRVRQLARTRTEALDTGAAEIRRIERDLHDGAQARLVAMGMTLDLSLIHI